MELYSVRIILEMRAVMLWVYTHTNSLSDDAPGLSEQYLYGSSRIGVATPDAGARVTSQGETLSGRSFGRKSYELSDHLGNVRATLSDYKKGASPQVQSATDYYPFGMVARTYASSQQYRYGFNGKEHEDGVAAGDYDFGARIYDSRLTRWLSIDVLFKKYPDLSPYVFGGNCPILIIDLDGERIAGVSYDKKTGTFSYTEAAIKRGTDVYIAARITTQAGKASILNLMEDKITYKITVTDKIVVSGIPNPDPNAEKNME